MNQPPYYFRRAFVLPLPGREEVCRAYTLDYTEQEVEVLRSWKTLGENVYFSKRIERAEDIEMFLHQCLQETGGARLKDAYEERERLSPHIPSDDPRFYTHCQVCHEPVAGRTAAWMRGSTMKVLAMPLSLSSATAVGRSAWMS